MESSDRQEQLRSQGRDILCNPEHEEAIDAICEANGWTRDDFINNRPELQSMELFLLQFGPSIPQLKFFPFLVTLKLHHVGLTEMRHLENLVNLEVLWMSENDIQKIDGLENCEKLRELYLHNNLIRRMEGLKRLKQLQVLWLCRNQISSIEETEHLPKLRSLWLAGNRITSLRHAFPSPMPSLTELNVASNKIASFRDIPTLNELHLKALEHLYFSDPLYGDNPVCQLSNYQTFTLFHLPQVRTLDFVHISAEQRQLAESTFVKKKIYYSMRIHTIQRNLNALISSVQALASKKCLEAESSMSVLERIARNLEQDTEEFSQYGTTSAPDLTFRNQASYERAKSDLTKVKHAISSRRREVELIERKRAETCRCMHMLTDTHISRLMLELNTGGNVRLEEGKTKEVWFQSCGELIRTRFFAADFDSFSIKDIVVNKVTRVHNRGLRSSFDHALGNLVDLSDPSYKRALEYLFYALPLSTDADVNDALEHGFSPSTYGGGITGARSAGDIGDGDARGRHPNGVPMTNSVFLAEQQRLLQAARSGDLKLDALEHSTEVLVGRIVVCKVFLGKCCAEKSSAVNPAAGEALVCAAPKLIRGDYANGTSSVYRCKPQDPKQRIWYCLEPDLVLPEYVVEFSYTSTLTTAPIPATAEFGPANVEDTLSQLKRMYPTSSAVDIADFRTIGVHSLSFIKWCETSPFSAIATKDAAEVLSNPISFCPRPGVGGELSDAHAESYLSLVRVGASSSSTPLVNFHSLRINSWNLSKSAMLKDFASLKELVLFDNELTTLPWRDIAEAAPQLECLDVSHNQIKRLQEWGQGLSFPKLQTLLLDHNFLFMLDDIKWIHVAAPKLQHLTLSQNPCTSEKRALQFICSAVPSIEMLNFILLSDSPDLSRHRVTPKDLDGPLLGYLIPTADTLSGHVLSGDGPIVEPTRLFRCYDDAAQLYIDFAMQNQGLAPVPIVATVSQLPPVQVFALNGCQLDSLERVERLRKIAHLQLRSNFINDMSLLMALTQLETLDLGDNRITRIQGLASLTKLRRLDLSKNCIDRLEGLETLKSLQFLAVSHNSIKSLAPLSQSTSLLEFYCSNNAIESEKEALSLRDLPKLIILDLAGNPCVSLSTYRSYVVFQVKRLKVLDGISIDASEIQQSRDTFAGRISAELLKERLPPGTEWGAARELSLASCALKEITLLDAFTALTHLKLEHNMLVTIEGLKPCINLVALNLSHNRLGQCVVGKVFECMPNLESLSLEANGIASIAALQLNCPRLKFLNLKSNEILKVDGLDRVGHLREILLDKNRLRAIDRDALLFVPYLRELYCEENAIKSIEGVHVAVQLQKVSFASNRINEVADIGKHVEGLPIVDICFLGNPVVRKAYYRNHLIHSLPNAQVIDNRVVTPEERERVESSFQQDTIPPNVFTDVRMAIQGGPIVVPAPPSQKIPLKMLSLDAEGGGGGAQGASSSTGLPSGNQRGRPPQTTGFGTKAMPGQSPLGMNGNTGSSSSAPRTNSADLRSGVIPVSSGPRVSAPSTSTLNVMGKPTMGGPSLLPSGAQPPSSFRKK